ncbi:NAD(P)-dependent oxidoreductase [Pyrodictium abyssi]|uniref:NAD-dependent epimerase/dehydratase domain-containing protein n=1 Tax=Pyrodictium abyssi TaxID=54256 RepID=A0ABN6ZQY6_9CREN|nr:hypothetical protein PABY_22340 [Pyrodictium abyssi]
MGYRVLIIGGIGYLGYNLALEHSSGGDTVYVVARRSSAEKRPLLFEELKQLTERILLTSTLHDPADIQGSIDSVGCPDIAYMAVGKLQGTREELMEANAVIPKRWAELLSRRCIDALYVYISNTLAVGDASKCAQNGRVVEEAPHLRGCRPVGPHGLSKMEGERNVMSVCRRTRLSVAILRPGLLVGRWCYHDEWRILYRLARLHIRISGGPFIHAAPARDIAVASRLLRDRMGDKFCGWFYATPWRGRLGELHRLLHSHLGVRGSMPLPLPRLPRVRLPGLPEILAEYSAQQRLVFEPYALNELGMEWRSIDEAVREAAEWLKNYMGEKL